MSCYNASSIFLWYRSEGHQYHLTRMEPPANTIYMSHTTTIGQQSWLLLTSDKHQPEFPARPLSVTGQTTSRILEWPLACYLFIYFTPLLLDSRKHFNVQEIQQYTIDRNVKYFQGKCSHYRYIARAMVHHEGITGRGLYAILHIWNQGIFVIV